jgi:hypothetical protein
MRIAKVYLEKDTVHTLYIDFKDEEDAKEIVLKSMEDISGMSRDQLLKVLKVEIIIDGNVTKVKLWT